MLKKYFSSPAHCILISAFITIICGTALLALPLARHVPISVIDLVFTATSATCVTGLLTIPLASFTGFGKIIILMLIQIGGLGLLTLTFFLLSFFTDLSLSTQFMVGKLLDVDTWKKGKNILSFILITTGLAELFGTIALYFSFSYDPYWCAQPIAKKIWYALFHALSSCNNAGFTLFEDGMHGFSHNMPFIISTGILVFLGSFGFIPLYELAAYYFQKKNKALYLSLQTKIIVSTTFFIVAISTLIFLLLEPKSLLVENDWMHAFIDALFNAISSRNAGLLTYSIASLSNATLFFILIIAFIGSAPGSSGSGIKITNFAILLATIRAVLQGTLNVRIKGREIPKDLVFKAFCIITLSISWITSILFILLIVHPELTFFQLFFEIVSAFTTLGLSLGITPYLSYSAKMLIIATMFIGRVGSITLVLAMSRSLKADYHYPEERIMIS